MLGPRRKHLNVYLKWVFRSDPEGYEADWVDHQVQHWYIMAYQYLYLKGPTMPRLKPSQDVQPLSAFRANAAGFLDQVRATKRPLVLTQHGKSAAVVLDVDEYEALVEQVELIRDIRDARAEMARGEGIAHGEVVAELRSRLKR